MERLDIDVLELLARQIRALQQAPPPATAALASAGLPEHQWRGPWLQLRRSDGQWGEAVNLAGPPGPAGPPGARGPQGRGGASSSSTGASTPDVLSVDPLAYYILAKS